MTVKKHNKSDCSISKKQILWLIGSVLFWSFVFTPVFSFFQYYSGYIANFGVSLLSISLCVYCLMFFGLKLPRSGYEYKVFFYPIFAVIFALLLALFRKLLYT